MADLGISHTHADQYGSVRGKRQLTARGKFHFAINTALVAAAFAFVAAVVCGVIA